MKIQVVVEVQYEYVGDGVTPDARLEQEKRRILKETTSLFASSMNVGSFSIDCEIKEMV